MNIIERKPIGKLRIDTDGSLEIPELHLIGDAIQFQLERKHRMIRGEGILMPSQICGETVITITFRGDVEVCLPPAKRKRGRGVKTQRWVQIATKAHACSAVPSGMVEELLAYSESLRMAVESAYREGFQEGCDRDPIPDDEFERQTDNAWAQSKANEVIHPRED